jgi:glycosyltransferase involved in cell wall biosynthesis
VTADQNHLVSVIIPAFNAEAYLAETLESVLAQDWQPCEVIVVDDGSTDATADVARSFSGVRYVRRANGGAAAARNTGVAQAHGDLIANLDSDDLMAEGRLRVQAEHLLANEGVGCVFGRQEWLNPPPWLTRDAVFGDLDGIPLNSAMFRRHVLRELGGYDESFTRGEDLDLVVRMRERGIEFTVLPDIVVYRRYHGDSLSAAASPHENLIRSLRAKLDRSRPAEPVDPDAREANK